MTSLWIAVLALVALDALIVVALYCTARRRYSDTPEGPRPVSAAEVLRALKGSTGCRKSSF